MTNRVALVSCVKSKLSKPAAAKDLYTSSLFRGMRRYAELNVDTWYILSAEHGVLHPEQVVAPYEKTLNRMRQADRLAWSKSVEGQLAVMLPLGVEVVMLAGERYREHLLPFLNDQGFLVTVPMAGLSLGRQLAWLSSRVGRGGDAS